MCFLQLRWSVRQNISGCFTMRRTWWDFKVKECLKATNNQIWGFGLPLFCQFCYVLLSVFRFPSHIISGLQATSPDINAKAVLFPPQSREETLLFNHKKWLLPKQSSTEDMRVCCQSLLTYYVGKHSLGRQALVRDFLQVCSDGSVPEHEDAPQKHGEPSDSGLSLASP